MFYYSVAPLLYFGQEAETLTYKSINDVKIGTAVVVPLRNKKVTGIVMGTATMPDFETKEIIGKIFDKPVISKEMISVARFISEYYSASLVSVLQTIIPPGLTKRRRAGTINTTLITTKEGPKLTTEQSGIVNKILQEGGKRPHLLFGVTGSGKTEVYMSLIEETLKKGEGAIVLVPEISLTPQAMDRYQNRFGDKVTILHSYLKETERFSNWKSVLMGERNIVIGSRSAIFAPIKNLGLIIIDEEHESTYKQDRTPKYETAKVAEKISELTGALLVLGSATPKIETFYKAKNGELILHSLSNRFVQNKFPETEIVDMRNEMKSGNYSIFSEKLRVAMERTLGEKKQVILFINRRGMSTFVSCRDCGFVEKCPNCETSLTFHYNQLNLQCHHCGYTKKPEAICPVCNSTNIKYFGTGTQKVEAELNKLFGNKYKIARMDADTTKARDSHRDLYNAFAEEHIDILVGTQMISKGWDLPNVGLVGIITSDTLINFPDFTAAERTFNLLTQVGGRTGRGIDRGKVIIQTYNPDYFAITAASKHDYPTFFNKELENRKDLSYPPFARLVKIVYNNIVQSEAKTASATAKNDIENRLKQARIEHQILGPAPAFLPKLNNKYYYQITLKLFDQSEINTVNTVTLLRELLNENWSIDVDPMDLL